MRFLTDEEDIVATALRTWHLSKTYHGRAALSAMNLTVPSDVVFGYLGPNGAGKTTTIRLLAGLLRPSSGRAEIGGYDVVRDRERAQRQIGYLPGDFAAYPRLTAAAYLDHLGYLRGGPDRARIRSLADRLDLDLNVRIGAMSHGNRQKVGIVQAFMHAPALLVLDEPTAGLDPLIQRQFLELVREARERGQTVFLSSHNLYEVEAVADMVGILVRGRLAVVEEVDKLKAQAVRRIDLTFAGVPPDAALRGVAAVQQLTVTGHTAHLVVEGHTAELLRIAAPYGVEQIVTHEPDLEEVFLSYYDAQE
ncbi:ABC-2 type transport system ATP-binding protein [Actinoplanes octamycinicus]|uniref:ABC-2 type transport system ATP-binding protein n=1 Tax=Actinoplanes octamycinicus TaxID=135948 RepID=A0A7W7H2G6_9ACTN|nr:ABC transporter ATP-binding protein [Actinoplanes octamycinicus]MBB4742776.1 ABC-2 type transport system ATP-binding protein [Actinoplanes octamycinicus]GIE58369.1 ABC transporter [Actinoplanes octamycinicus]